MLTHGQPLASQVVWLASRLSSETSALHKSDERERLLGTVSHSRLLTNSITVSVTITLKYLIIVITITNYSNTGMCVCVC